MMFMNGVHLFCSWLVAISTQSAKETNRVVETLTFNGLAARTLSAFDEGIVEVEELFQAP